jgi:protein SCO1/2
MRARSKALWLLALVMGFGAACGRGPELPKLSEVPAFELRDQDAEAVSRDRLRGQIWIANFMFTSCPDVCPILTTKMAGVRGKLVAERVPVRIVSFSVDPGTDTPAVLKKYAVQRHADYPDWRFLTGPIEDIKHVLIEGFKQAYERQPEQAGQAASILHGSHFVLVDRASRIRGYYPSDEDGLLKLVRDARILAAEKEQGS